MCVLPLSAHMSQGGSVSLADDGEEEVLNSEQSLQTESEPETESDADGTGDDTSRSVAPGISTRSLEHGARSVGLYARDCGMGLSMTADMGHWGIENKCNTWQLCVVPAAVWLHIVLLVVRFAPAKCAPWMHNNHTMPVNCFQILLSASGVTVVFRCILTMPHSCVSPACRNITLGTSHKLVRTQNGIHRTPAMSAVMILVNDPCQQHHQHTCPAHASTICTYHTKRSLWCWSMIHANQQHHYICPSHASLTCQYPVQPSPSYQYVSAVCPAGSLVHLLLRMLMQQLQHPV